MICLVKLLFVRVRRQGGLKPLHPESPEDGAGTGETNSRTDRRNHGVLTVPRHGPGGTATRCGSAILDFVPLEDDLPLLVLLRRLVCEVILPADVVQAQTTKNIAHSVDAGHHAPVLGLAGENVDDAPAESRGAGAEDGGGEVRKDD